MQGTVIIMPMASGNYPEIIVSLRLLHLGLTFSINLLKDLRLMRNMGWGRGTILQMISLLETPVNSELPKPSEQGRLFLSCLHTLSMVIPRHDLPKTTHSRQLLGKPVM